MVSRRPDGSSALRALLPFVASLLLALPFREARAHPGVGLVRDRAGNVFYTDLVHVWRITPDGRKAIVVRDVHTHELAMDERGNLYGEDNRYLGSGEGDDRYRHRIWRRSPDGRVTDVIPWSAGFWSNYGFVRDPTGATYWTHCPAQRCSIRRRAPVPEGAALRSVPVTTVARPGQFTSRINWIAASATEPGVLFVVDGLAVRRLDPSGRVTTIVAGLGAHAMGLWPTADGAHLYAAVYGARAIVRVRLRDGQTTTVARSPAPWGPSGVLVAPDGHLWVLEYSSATNAARVRRIAPNGTSRVF